MKYKEISKQDAINIVKDVVEKSNLTIYTILRHVSNSGMLRVISPIVIVKDKNGKCELWDISYYVSRILNYKLDKKYHGIRIHGCGMDMGFHLVYTLSYEIFNDGYVIKQKWI